MGSMDWDSCFVFKFWKSEIKIYVGVDAIIVSILSFETRFSISASLPVNDGSDKIALLS